MDEMKMARAAVYFVCVSAILLLQFFAWGYVIPAWDFSSFLTWILAGFTFGGTAIFVMAAYIVFKFRDQ